MTVRLLRRLMSADVLGLLLILVALQALTYGISSSLASTDTTYFFWVCLFASLLAMGLSRRNVDGIQAALGMIGLGVLGVWILGARLAAPLWNLGESLLSILPQIEPAIRAEIPIDATAVSEAWLVVAQASTALSLRVQTWLFGLNRNITVNDPLIRNLVWLLIIWLIAAWMGWFAGRRNAIAALVPSIVLLALITSYSERRVETLWLLVFVLLLLMGIWNYRNHTAQWESKKVDYSDSIRYDVSQAVIILSIILGIAAFITPSISWREIRDFLRARGENQIAETLGVQQQQIAAQPAPAPKPSLPREHLLSGGFAQSQEVVMTIRTGELPPVVNPSLTAAAPRYYWRSTTYDMYVGAGWVNSGGPSQRLDANTPLIPGLLNDYRNLHLDVEMVEPEGKLFWSGILFSADVPITVGWRLKPASDLFADQSDLLQTDMFAAASNADIYRAEAYIPTVTIAELRLAGTEYPEEIRDRYLRLPSSVPERVHELAREITQGRETAYDQAKAIEAYLREYPYDLEVPAPPEEHDVADYFLFDLRKGYCDYYATAMVVLARASGLPARFVSGYASGSYDAANAQYIVQELHAHSWAEVYFPEIGWIEFEPTAAQPEIELPEFEEELTGARPSDATATRLLNRFRLEQLLYWLSPIAILLLGFILYFAVIERWLYMRLAPAAAVEKIYRRLYRLGRPLAGERTRAETAQEFMRKLMDAVDRLGARSRFRKSFLNAGQEVELLTNLYQGTLFADHSVQKQDVHKALNSWKRLRLRLWIARLTSSLNHVIPSKTRNPAVTIAKSDMTE